MQEQQVPQVTCGWIVIASPGANPWTPFLASLRHRALRAPERQGAASVCVFRARHDIRTEDADALHLDENLALSRRMTPGDLIALYFISPHPPHLPARRALREVAVRNLLFTSSCAEFNERPRTMQRRERRVCRATRPCQEGALPQNEFYLDPCKVSETSLTRGRF